MVSGQRARLEIQGSRVQIWPHVFYLMSVTNELRFNENKEIDAMEEEGDRSQGQQIKQI